MTFYEHNAQNPSCRNDRATRLFMPQLATGPPSLPDGEPEERHLPHVDGERRELGGRLVGLVSAREVPGGLQALVHELLRQHRHVVLAQLALGWGKRERRSHMQLRLGCDLRTMTLEYTLV